MAASLPDQGLNPVAGMFGRIAPGYDLLNRVLSGGLDILWRRRLVRSVRPRNTGRLLDLAAGTLDVSLALAKRHPGARVLALDFCPPMLLAGLPKLAKAGRAAQQAVKPVAADAFRLPLADACVDAVTVAFGLRNMPPRVEALKEMRRVLAPGGVLHVLEFGSARRPVWGGLYNFYLRRLLPLAGGLISGDKAAYEYLSRTVEDFPSAEELAAEFNEAGFTDVGWTKLSGGIVFLHEGRKSFAEANE